MQAWHQNTLLGRDFPMNIFITDDTEYPPHWHEAVEVVYSLEDGLCIGVNHEVYTLNSSDILIINGGDVHYFLPHPNPVNRIILLFDSSFFESFASVLKDKRFAQTYLTQSNSPKRCNGFSIHQILKNHILEILNEYEKKIEGYQLLLKARLFDILVVLLRNMPVEAYSPYEKVRHQNRLERLQQVFHFVEQNYERHISLNEVAAIANFSVFHFSRFFKETTGMTFIQYINNFRVTKAEELLRHTNDTITDVSFKSGFGSIKTFNRIFKEIKNCTPSEYRRTL